MSNTAYTLYMPTLSTENKTKTEIDEEAHPQRRKCWSLPRPASVSITQTARLQQLRAINFSHKFTTRPLRHNTSACIDDQKRKRMRPGQQLYLYPWTPLGVSYHCRDSEVTGNCPKHKTYILTMV